MKTVITAMLLFITLSANAEVIHQRNLSKIVLTEEAIKLQQKDGSNWSAKLNCDYELQDVTKFAIRGRVLKEGTRVRLSHKTYCRVVDLEKV